MSFTNLYYKRAVGTARACYVCNKPTTIVLATINTADFIYTCAIHLTDPGFATQLKEENGTKSAAAAISAEEIAKIKAEWEEKQKKKQEKEKEKEKEKGKDGEGSKAKEKDSDSSVKADDKGKKSEGVATPSTSVSPSPAAPAHEKYILHRDFFSMRQMEHRRRRQAAQAKDVASRMPTAPQGGMS